MRGVARLGASLGLALWSVAGLTQIETAPLDEARPVAPRQVATPPVLPAHPQRPALQAIASGGSGGLSYSGPAGAMNTSPQGASCAVTCALGSGENYSISCDPGNTAFCQCDRAPYAACLAQ